VARFEKDGRFVELWLEEVRTGGQEFVYPTLFSREGRIGERPDPAALATRYEFTARRDMRGMMSERLRDGWRRVRDPEREVDVDDEPREPRFDTALLANPDDAATALVYADWLEHRGHPRGQLIAVQHAGLADEAEQLLDQHRDELLGPLDRGEALELVWERGFVKRARIERGDSGDDGPEALWDLLRHPSSRFLRELVIGCHSFGDQNNELMADLLMRAGPHPPLRVLELADFDQTDIDNIDISRAPIGDLTQLGACYPLLEDIVLKGSALELGALELPRARRFALRTSSMTKRLLESITRASWPVLEELELWFGDPDRGYGADCEHADARAIFAMVLPKLRVLALRNAMFSDELVPDLLAWPASHQLEQLDFALGTLSDDGARALIAGKANLPKLERLGVFECSLTTVGLAALREAGFAVDEHAIAPAFAWRAPQQKTNRYTSVNE
jgi:uncharacterized protein (TIGR02996 family)